MSHFLVDPPRMTAVYFALNALVMLVLGMLVVRRRAMAKVAIGDGGNEALIRAIGAHGNNAEYVPITLLMLFLVTLLGGTAWFVHGIGAPLTIGRILHAVGLSRHSGTSVLRFSGTALTWIAVIVGILALVWLAFSGVPSQGQNG